MKLQNEWDRLPSTETSEIVARLVEKTPGVPSVCGPDRLQSRVDYYS